MKMLQPDLVALVEELEGLGVKFTVVPRLDGSLRLNTWRMQNSWLNRDRINQLLAERIENAPEVAAKIAQWISIRPAEAADPRGEPNAPEQSPRQAKGKQKSVKPQRDVHRTES
jgi:hypothetical protein